MEVRVRRQILLGGISTVVAAGIGLVTNVFSGGWRWPWGAALAALVVVGAVLQAGQLLVAPRAGVDAEATATGRTVVRGNRSVGAATDAVVVTGDGNTVGSSAERGW
jgi:hypothetical protein